MELQFMRKVEQNVLEIGVMRIPVFYFDFDP